MSFIHQCLIFDSHPAELLPQFCYLLFRSECLYAMYVYKFDLAYVTYVTLASQEQRSSNQKAVFCLFSFYSILYSLQLVVCI